MGVQLDFASLETVSCRDLSKSASCQDMSRDARVVKPLAAPPADMHRARSLAEPPKSQSRWSTGSNQCTEGAPQKWPAKEPHLAGQHVPQSSAQSRVAAT